MTACDPTAGPWGRADVDALRSLTAAGLTDAEIAARVGRSAVGVYRKRAALGIRKHGRVRRRVKRLAARGYETWEIALRVGRSESAVRVVKAGLKITLKEDTKCSC